jgi:hypothetical protein
MGKDYIKWLYFENPLGNVVGFDAIESGKVVSHYACVPTSIDGVTGLLSVNTATHPDFRSQGFHKTLANKTYEYWSKDFNFVVGVANAQSVGTFVKHLGFKELGNLNLRYGRLQRPKNGRRSWTSSQLDWRIECPRQKIQREVLSTDVIELSVRPRNFVFNLKSIIHLSDASKSEINAEIEVDRIGFTVDWIRDSKSRVRLPDQMKPSPLVLIFQSLGDTEVEVNSWSYSDFDVF